MAINFACRTEARTPRRHNDMPPGISRCALQPVLRPRPATDPPVPDIGTRPATAPSAVLRRPMRRHVFLATPRQSGRNSSPQNKGAADCSAPPIVSRELPYFRLVIAVRSAESLAMPAAPHQLEPNAVAPLPGLIAVTKPGLALVVL